MQIRGILRNVRISTRDPRAQHPSDRTLLVLLSRQVQNLLLEANLRGGSWAVDEAEVTVGPNNTEYIVPVEGFGKAIEVRAVYPANIGHPEHDVDFYELGDLNFQPDAPFWTNWFPESFGPPYTRHRVAFYRKQGGVYLRTGQGQSGATYRIIYQVGVFGQTVALEEEVMMPEFAHLIELRTAIASLPHCEWFDDEDRNERRRKELALTLVEEARTAYQLFKSYAATQTAASQPTQRILDSID